MATLTTRVGDQNSSVMTKVFVTKRYIVARPFNVFQADWNRYPNELGYNVDVAGTKLPLDSPLGLNFAAKKTPAGKSKISGKQYMGNTPPSPNGLYGYFISASKMGSCARIVK